MSADVDREDDRIDPGDAADDVVHRVRTHVDYRRDPSQAREAVARSVIAQSYYQDDTEWRRVKDADGALMRAVAKASAGEHPRDRFTRDAERVLRRIYRDDDLTVEGWVRSERFRDLERVVWESYVANVLVPWERPDDREELVRWLRIFHVARAAVEGDEEVGRAVHAAPTARPAIPFALFDDPRPAEEGAVAEEGAELVDARAELAEERGRYEQALSILRQLANEKRARAPRRPREPVVREVEGAREMQVAAGGFTPDEAPWALTEADLDQRPEVRATLERAGLPAPASIPEAVEAIEQALAENVARVAEHSFRRDIVGAGRTMRVREWIGDRPEVGRRWPIG